MQCAEIRQKFVEYYEKLGFQFLPRAPMMHPSIPMSFVMSAGLVQVETSLANTKDRSGNQFVLVQDCFRHFDLERIGTDNIHLSLFEMPGAFVFDVNGRQTTIRRMWNLATEVLGIDPQRIWVSYFGGDQIGGQELPRDELTYHAWREVGVPAERLVGLGRDNYWMQGGGMQHTTSAFRKCGPNTELFYDLGQEKVCSSTCRPGCRCGRFVEFSNSLFISSNFHPETHELLPIDDPFTETVIGTERVAMILQKVPSVFDIDSYRSIIDMIHQFVTPDGLPDPLIRESERVIADHLRALYVLVADGAPPPGKNGRKRIMKLLIRAIITRQIVLGVRSEKSFPKLIESVLKIIDNNSQPLQIEKKLKEYFDNESHRFQKTIEQGKREFERMLGKNQRQTLSGSQILSLEKEYGLPRPLICDLLRQKNLKFLDTEYERTLFSLKQSLSHRAN